MLTASARHPERVLVAGAAGFVGSEIVRQLCSLNLSVRTTDRIPEPPPGLPSYRPADLRNPAETEALLDGVDCVINASGIAHIFNRTAETDKLMYAVNGDAAGALARAAVRAGVSHLVLVSSVGVYGSPGTPSVDEAFPCSPSGPYEESKYQGERQAAAAVSGSRTRLTILRPATIYGPGDRGNVARLIRTIDHGRFVWIGDGRNLKSLVFREDFARACVRAALGGSDSDVYNVSAPPETMRAIVDSIAEALGKRPPRLSIPAGFARSMTTLAAHSPVARPRFQALRRTVGKWLAHDAYDASKFAQRFGQIAAVPLREGIRREVEWYASRN